MPRGKRRRASVTPQRGRGKRAARSSKRGTQQGEGNAQQHSEEDKQHSEENEKALVDDAAAAGSGDTKRRKQSNRTGPEPESFHGDVTVFVIVLAAVALALAASSGCRDLSCMVGKSRGPRVRNILGAETVTEDVRVAVRQHIDTHTQSATGGARDDYRQPLCVIVAATDERTCSDVGKLARSWAWLARDALLGRTSAPLVEYNESIGVPKSAWQTAVVPRLDAPQSRSAVVQLHKLCDEKVAPQPTAVITVGACITGDGGAAAREEDGGPDTETALAQSMWDELRRYESTEEEFDAMFSRVAGRIIVVGEPDEKEGNNEDEDGIADDEVAERTRGLYAVAKHIAGKR